jgi:hypothetical protein
MISADRERRRKLNDDFDNVFREHDRLQQDLNSVENEQYQSLLNSIDKWEQDAIKKIQKTAKNARNDVQRLLKDTNHQLQRVLNDTVTEGLREALQQKNKFTEFDIDKWLVNLSEIRRQLETISSIVDFSHDKVINLIKVKRKRSSEVLDRIYLDYEQFYFELIRGHPIFYNTEHLISSAHPATILSQNKYFNGTHYFRFRIEKTTDELFFGIISDKDHQKLKENILPISSIHGWWNIDRRVVGGRKEPYVSTLNIYNGDEIILMINCDARQIFLEYPSMAKLNSLQLIDDIRECLPPWKLLIEIGKPGRCLIRLLDWGITAHGTNHPERRLHCFCSSD